VFCIYLRTNSDLCHLQHKLIGFYNRDEKCLQRGTDWVFKYTGLRFVFKGLIPQSSAGRTVWQDCPNILVCNFTVLSFITSESKSETHRNFGNVTLKEYEEDQSDRSYEK